MSDFQLDYIHALNFGRRIINHDDSLLFPEIISFNNIHQHNKFRWN